MKFARYSLLVIAAVGLVGSLGYIVYAPEDPAPTTALVADDLAGNTMAFDDFAGEILIVDFWATWCGPCITEIPHYNRLDADYRDKGVHLIGVTVESGTADEVAAFADDEDHHITYPLVMGNDDVVNAYGPVFGLPTTLLIDQDGKVVKRWLGAAAGKSDQLRELIDKLLAGEPIE